ncbi:hypothetical protein [Niastella koreensis]|nr:hypothetical protein [Niastella koreensis]
MLQCREAIRAKGFTGYHLQDALEEEDFREGGAVAIKFPLIN